MSVSEEYCPARNIQRWPPDSLNVSGTYVCQQQVLVQACLPFKPPAPPAPTQTTDSAGGGTPNRQMQTQDVAAAAVMAQYGIRVRDFAYESTLPPIASVSRVPPQIQPGPTVLKRTRQEDDGEDNPDDGDAFVRRTSYYETNLTGTSHHTYVVKPAPLERTLTEPADDSVSYQRTLGIPNLVHHLSNLRTLPTLARPLMPRRVPVQYPAGANNQTIPQPELQETSQDSEWIDTPLVTPNGSLHWPVTNTEEIPTAQLDSKLQRVTEVSPYSHPGSLPHGTFSRSETIAGPSQPQTLPFLNYSHAPSPLSGDASPPPKKTRHIALPELPTDSEPARYELRNRTDPPSSRANNNRASRSTSPRRLMPTRASRPRGRKVSNSSPSPRPLRRSARNTQGKSKTR